MEKQNLMLPLKLQLFAGEGATDISNALEEVVTPQTEENTDVTSEVATEVVEEVAEPQQEVEKSVQTPEQNAMFAKFRREQETKLKAEQAKSERLLKTLNSYGYEGSPEEIADMLEAQKTGKPAEQVKQERKQFEQQQEREQQMQAELEELKNFKYDKIIENDINAINKAYPDAKVKSLDDLGAEFMQIMQTGTVDSVTAFEIIQARKAKTEVKKPITTGAVNSSSTQEKDFYTSDEVDNLSAKDLDNPKIFKKVIESMTKW